MRLVIEYPDGLSDIYDYVEQDEIDRGLATRGFYLDRDDHKAYIPLTSIRRALIQEDDRKTTT